MCNQSQTWIHTDETYSEPTCLSKAMCLRYQKFDLQRHADSSQTCLSQDYSIAEESVAYIFRSVLEERYAKLNSGAYVSTDIFLERSATTDTRKRICYILSYKKQTLWPESKSELYRPSDILWCKKGKSCPCNRPYRPIGLWDVRHDLNQWSSTWGKRTHGGTIIHLKRVRENISCGT
jgi:hypothetical protein